MILKLEFAGTTKKACFSNLKKNIVEIEKQIIKENITVCCGIFGNTGHRYMVLNNFGKMIRKYRRRIK